jgi:hypothetical protein
LTVPTTLTRAPSTDATVTVNQPEGS